MRLLAVTFGLGLALAACGGPRNAAPENAGLGAITAITLNKSACYGTCPDYTVRFTADGRATYRGGHYAPLHGKFSGLVDFRALAAWLATQHPETLRNYPTMTDGQTVTLVIDHGARRQIVVSSRGLGPEVPLRLDGILLALDGATMRVRWRRDDAATSFLGTFAGPSAPDTGLPTPVDVDQAVNGEFFAYGRTLPCNGRTSLTRDRDTMRFRCGPHVSVLRVTAAGFRAEGDALPSGEYHRIDPHGASVLWGSPQEPRIAE
jgi:hypothetical protein